MAHGQCLSYWLTPLRAAARSCGAWARSVGSRVARINARLTRRAGSPRALIGHLGIVTTASPSLAPPITYAAISTLQLQQRAEEQAMLGARHVEVQLPQQERRRPAQPGLDQRAARHPQPHSVVVASWVTDDDRHDADVPGQVPPRGRRCEVDKPIRTPQFKGSFHIAVSTREVFIGTFYVAARLLPARAGRLLLLPAAAAGGAGPGAAGCSTPSNPSCCRRSTSWRCRTCASTRRSTTCPRACACATASTSSSSAMRPTCACTDCRPSWPSRARRSSRSSSIRLAKGLHIEQSPDDYLRDLRGDHRRRQAGDQDPRAQRRAHHRHQASADAGRAAGCPRTRT